MNLVDPLPGTEARASDHRLRLAAHLDASTASARSRTPGAAAVVMPSLFEEQIRAEDTAYAMYTEHGSFSQSEAGSYFPEMPDYDRRRIRASRDVRRAVAAVDIPVIASLNGSPPKAGSNYAARLEQAGAAALELNIYFIPADPTHERRRTSRRATSKSCAR